MKLLLTLALCLSMSLVFADTSKVIAQESLDAAELNQFRNSAMDAIDNPYCRGLFKRYLKKKNPKVFIYVPRKKERTGYCKLALTKAASGDLLKKLLKRCEKKRKKAKKNPFISSCKVFARNNKLLITRQDFGLKEQNKDIFYVSERYGVAEVKKMIDAGTNINQQNDLGLTPLLIAVRENNLDIVKLLVSKGADLTLKNKRGENAIIIATKDNFADSFEYLLTEGADITTTDQNGRQLIHIAARAGHIGILDILLNKGVDINQETTNKELPLHLAVQSLYVPTVKYLVKKGANINAIDRSGKTPLDNARKFGTKRMVEYLIKQGAKSADSLK